MQPYPILFLGTQITTGGAQRVLLSLAGCFHAQGNPVTAAFFYDKDGLLKSWQQEYPFPIVVLGDWARDAGPIRKAGRVLSSLVNLYRLMRQQGYSVLLTFTHDSNLLGLPAAWLAGVPVRIGSHHGRIRGFSSWKERLHTTLANSRATTRIIAVSRATWQACLDEGIHPEKLVLIANGVPAREAEVDAREQMRAALGIAAHEKMVLAVGRLEEEKGHADLVDAAAMVLDGREDVQFVVVGDGSLLGSLKDRADRLGIGARCQFVGVSSQIAELLAAADLFVLPSRTEGLPMALLEAMQAGKAIVATRAGGVEDVIDAGVSGVLVPPQDPPALAREITALLDDPARRERLAAAARQAVQAGYTLEQMCAGYAGVFDDCLQAVRSHAQ